MTISRYHVESNFFERAEEMRAVFDAHFDNPYESPSSWEYVFVEGLYTHLRARPRSWLSDVLFEAFSLRLRTWCRERLGLVPSNEPRLDLMVEGYSLSLHSDFHNGAMGYVYSLTRWAQRTFRGGETLLLRDGIPNYKRHQVHGAALHESIPAHFNQLLVFDDRVVHATPQIEGNMDPLQGRLALVGHLRAGMPKVSGALREADVGPVLLDYQHSLREPLSRHPDVQGTVSYRPGHSLTHRAARAAGELERERVGGSRAARWHDYRRRPSGGRAFLAAELGTVAAIELRKRLVSIARMRRRVARRLCEGAVTMSLHETNPYDPGRRDVR
jgi:hypothetical protein